MFTVRTTSLLVVSLLVLAPASVPAGGGMTFVSPDGRLSVWVPSMPTTRVDQLPPTESGGTRRRHTFAVEGPSYLLLAGIIELGDSGPPTKGDEAVFLDGMLTDLRNGLGARFKLDARNGTTDLTLASDPMKGRQLRGTIDGQPMIVRAYVGERCIYLLQVGYAKGDKAAAEIADRFLKSLVAKYSDQR